MKIQNSLFALFLTIGGVSFNPALAQGPDGSEGIAALSHGPGPVVARYLVTYVHSETGTPTRSATVVTTTNQSSKSCDVEINWFKGFIPTTPVCTTTAAVAPGVTHDFCSRGLPDDITNCNSTCDAELIFDEGKAIVSSTKTDACKRIGVEARVYYTTGETDTAVAAVSNPKIVKANEGNKGD